MSTFEEIQDREKGLNKSLSTGQLSMIALGGAIGTGLFLGSKFAIGFAGSAVVISYLIGGVIAFALMAVLAEMTVKHPTSGSFGAYAEYYVHPLAGFMTRYMYWSCLVLAVGTEVTAVGEYMQFWFPGVPPWIWVIVFSAALILVNLLNVKSFGTLEYWFSVTKVFAIIGFIILAIWIVFFSGRDDVGMSNITADGGWAPSGIQGIWFAVIVSIFSYLSIEMIAVAAGEAKDPSTAVRKALRVTALRLVVFYFLTLSLIVIISPVSEILAGGSPFVTAMNDVGIPWADSILNFVVLVAALSAMNSQLYISTRMMFSLARAGEAPRAFGKVMKKTGTPAFALLLCSIGIAVAAVIFVLIPGDAFVFMISISSFGAMFTWGMIFVSHIFFRRHMRKKGEKLDYRLKLAGFAGWFGAIMMVLVLITTPFASGFEATLVFGIPALIITVIGYYGNRAYRHRIGLRTGVNKVSPEIDL